MADRLPENARRLPPVAESARTIYKRLERYHGIRPELAGERLHEIKAKSGYGAADNVIFDLSGGVYDPNTLEWIGSLTEGGASPGRTKEKDDEAT
jgi:hypothetical protein